MKPFLKINDHLSLHLARLELADGIFAVVDAQRAYLRQWLPWVDNTKTVEDTRQFLRESMEHNSRGTRLTTFLLHENEVAGSLGVVQFFKDFKKCEMGYWLREDLQGKGFMSQACACLIDQLFKTKDLNRIEIFAATGNLRSQGVTKRLGFQKEGVLRQGFIIRGEFHDLALFSLLRDDWNKKF